MHVLETIKTIIIFKKKNTNYNQIFYQIVMVPYDTKRG